MSATFSRRISTMLATGERKSLRNKVLGLAGVAVALIVAHLLSLPALSMVGNAYCGIEEHEHGSACYTEELICGLPETPGVPVSHVHVAGCYESVRVLACDETTDDDAFSGGLSDIAESPVDVGGSEEPFGPAAGTGNQAHVHDEDCYIVQTSLVCGMEEGSEELSGGHQHSEECYESVFSCTLTEHKHTLSCYSNSEADVESAADWEATLPANLSGVWADDLIAVAESQLGYAESELNYWVSESGNAKGYTRYGDWYGDLYGDWCAMFASFCLNYAGIPAEYFPRESNCQEWIELLSSEDYQLYYPVGECAARAAEAAAEGVHGCEGVPAAAFSYFDASEPYMPSPGDLVFFDQDSDPDSDHVGIVTEVVLGGEDEPAKLKTIEGNASDEVRRCEYVLDDASIMGYGMLPIKPEGETVAFDVEQSSAQSPATASAEGDVFYHVGNWTYQSSWHTLGGLVRTFALVPVKEGYSTPEEFTPTNWTADAADANYVVTYCVDKNTEYAIRLGEYSTFRLDNSRFPEETRQRLAAIVMHSYPYITASEMRANMAVEYPELANCHESELIAAVQQSIWTVVNPTTTLGEVTFPSSAGSYKGVTVNFLEQSSVGEAHRSGDHIASITEYLLNLEPLVEIKVLSWNPTYTQTADGLYTLTVEVTLNRPVYPDERANVRLVAGERASQLKTVGEGESAFTLSMEGLTAKELLDSETHILVEGQRAQAYFYDSETYQDMIGGNWEQYEYDLSFAVGLPDPLTSVSVSKIWADGTPGVDSVEVSLLANGVKRGDSVFLSAENDWKYAWTDLPQVDLMGDEIAYTVSEQPVEGYLSDVELSDAAVTGKVWREVSSDEDFEAGGEYLLVFTSSGALCWNENSQVTGNNGGVLGWERVNLASTSSTPRNAIWVAEEGMLGLALKNAAKEESPYLYFGSRINFSTVGNSASCLGGYLMGGGWYYLKDINSYGYGTGTTSVDLALPLKVYKLDDAEPPTSDVNYIITNTKYVAKGSMAIKKVGADDDSKLLQGAHFDLYVVDPEAGTVEPDLGIQEKVVKLSDDSIVTGIDGTVSVDGLEMGRTYYLVETAPPAGYEMLSCPVCFRMVGTSDNPEIEVVAGSPGQSWAFVSGEAPDVLVVKNAGGYELPSTGGVGMVAWTIVGVALTGVAAFGIWHIRNRRDHLRTLS